MVYDLIVCGGTFDHFHKGHREFLTYAFSLGKEVVIGLTSDKYIEKSKIKSQKSNLIESYEIRKKCLEAFLSDKEAGKKVSIVKIDDLFGSTLSNSLLIDGIVVSNDTKKGAELINQKRKELELSPLEIFVAPSVNGEDGKPISSARIRGGEINREGRLYIKPLWLERDLILPENLKTELRKPLGEIIKEIRRTDNAPCIIAVGDVTVKKLNESSIAQDISTVDFKVARKKIYSSFLDLNFPKDRTIIIVENPSGHITHDLFLKIINIFRLGFDKKIIIKIDGEDDLAVLPLILAAPLNSVVYYGQPDVGLVKILVSEKIKNRAYDLASKFRPIETNTRGY
jgi:pantetheine-phosphate adenylyltransferase